uniref:Uncharacterized protein n=1 Tax=Lactuca sativa TaxID=4236 RepID=A0A9R1W8U4_LACSA|nr:hypothetical protein LSAT_V11C200066520 [Lactuca sativa]
MNTQNIIPGNPDDEYSGSKENISEGAWSEGSRSQGNRSERSGTDDDSEDEDFFVDLDNIVYDMDVNMKYFHMHVDEDVEWLPKTTKEASGSGVDFTEGEDLEVIDPDSFDSPIVVHPKAITLGQKFKTKKDVKDYINKHAVESKKDLHFEKNIKQGLGLGVEEWSQI